MRLRETAGGVCTEGGRATGVATGATVRCDGGQASGQQQRSHTSDGPPMHVAHPQVSTAQRTDGFWYSRQQANRCMARVTAMDMFQAVQVG